MCIAGMLDSPSSVNVCVYVLVHSPCAREVRRKSAQPHQVLGKEALWGASGGLLESRTEMQGQGGPSPAPLRVSIEDRPQFRGRAGQGHRHFGF